MPRLKNDSTINVALPAETKELLNTIAEEEGVDLSSLVRKELNTAIRRWKNKRRKNTQ